MTPQAYLESRLTQSGHHRATLQEQCRLRERGRKACLFDLITRKTFRKWSLPPSALRRIDRALDGALAAELPLQFLFRFGGYKLWRLEAAPEADWAEFFALAHYLDYLAPIAALHEPGVKLVFMLDDFFLEQIDNLPAGDVEAYFRSFTALCQAFAGHAPAGLTIEVRRHRSLFHSDADLQREFDATVEDFARAWREMSPRARAEALVSPALNIMWDGAQDLSRLGDGERDRMVERSAVMHSAVLHLPTIKAFALGPPPMILVSPAKGPEFVSLGSTRPSIIKFWSGTGALERRHGRYLDHVLSPKQASALRAASFHDVPVELLPWKNFRGVRVYDQIIDFSRRPSARSAAAQPGPWVSPSPLRSASG